MRLPFRLVLPALGLLLLGSQAAQAQTAPVTGVGIGTATPDASAALDVSSTKLGVLLPRVGLTGPTDAATITSPANGLLLYNRNATIGGLPQLVINTGTTTAPVWAPLGSNNWSLLGNAGTVATTNFLGTTDSVALSVRVNNRQVAQFQPGGALWMGDLLTNLYLGDHAGVNTQTFSFFGPAQGNNLFIGSYAGYTNDNGGYNDYIGVNAGYKAVGSNNQFYGYQAGYGATSRARVTGSYNQFIGYQAGYGLDGANTGGSYNQFIGYQAGYSNAGGIQNQYIGYQAGYSSAGYNGYFQQMPTNQFIGFQAGYSMLGGNRNSFVGYQSGYRTTGGSNTFLGYKSASFWTTGSSNTIIGSGAGQGTNSSGSNNSYLGANAGVYDTGTGNVLLGANTQAGPYDNTVVLGAGASAGASNVIVLGAAPISTMSPALKVGIGTNTPTEMLQVQGNILASGTITQNSDRRLKTNIRPLSGALASVEQLRGVRYAFLPGKGPEGEQLGVIAQEIEQVYPELVRTDAKTGLKSVNYIQLTPVLLEALKEMASQMQVQTALLDAQAAHQQQLEQQQQQTTASLDDLRTQLARLRGNQSASPSLVNAR